MPRQSKYSTNKEIEDEKYKAALYIRLSVEDGDKEESNSVTNQKLLLTEFIEENNDIELYNIYIDDGYSGTDFERPGFSKMLDALYEKKINTVVVKDLSRLGRNYIEVGNYIEKIFPLLNTRFIAVNDGIDSIKNPNSVNSVIVPFKNLINDEYCRDISNKIRAVLNVKKKKGEYVGAYAPYGYIKDPSDIHHLIIDDESAKVVKSIFNYSIEGFGRNAIAEKLNNMGILNPTGYKSEVLNQRVPLHKKDKLTYTWTGNTVRKILLDQVYCGDIVQNKGKLKSYKIHKRVSNPKSEWIIVEDTHEPIISREMFKTVAEGITSRDTRMNKNGKISLFAGHLKCADCGRAMTKKVSGKYKGKERPYHNYMCSTYLKNSKQLCTKHTIRNDELEKAVLDSIKIQISLIVDLKRIVTDIEESKIIDNKKSLLEDNLKSVEEKSEIQRKLRKSAYEDWKLGVISEKTYNEYSSIYTTKINEYDKQIEYYYKELKKVDSNSNHSEWADNFMKFKNVKELSRELIDNLIDEIYVYEDKKIKIKFKFEDEYNFLLNYIKEKHEIIEGVAI